MADLLNQWELAMDSHSIKASFIWFYSPSAVSRLPSTLIENETMGLVATYPVFILNQTLIITTNRNQKQQAVNVFETVNPFLALRSLATHVKHAVRQLTEIKDVFGDARSSKSRAQQILVVGHISIGPNSVHIVDEAETSSQHRHTCLQISSP